MKKISTKTIVLFFVFSISMLLASLSLAAPNPASVYCEEQGYQLEIRTDPESGGQYGVCVFPDKTECEEWVFYRGECETGYIKDNPTSKNTATPKRTSTLGIIGLIILFGIIMAMPSGKKKESKESGKPKY